MQPYVYLDHNASAAPYRPAREAAARWLLEGLGNPSSQHTPGRAANAAIEGARRRIAQLFGLRPASLTFTSGATEALHLALAGSLRPGETLLSDPLEHPAVAGAARAAGAQLRLVRPDALGRLDPAAFSALAAQDPAPKLVAVALAQSELGNLHAVEAIARAVAPLPVVCDAVQAWGKVPLDVPALFEAGVVAVVLSGHKIGAPPGVGLLLSRPGFAPRAWIDGGAQERGRRAGTENLPGIVGLAVAAEAVPARLAQMDRVRALRDDLERHLTATLGPRYVRHGDPAHRLPNTSHGRIEGLTSETLLAAFDLEGVAISAGTACSSGGLEPSATLLALGLSPQQARQGLRISLGPESSEADLQHFQVALARILARVEAAERSTAPCA